jgi:hypothetical protein
LRFGLHLRFGLRGGGLLPARGGGGLGFGLADRAAAGRAVLLQLPFPVGAAGFDRREPPGAADFPLDLGDPGASAFFVFEKPLRQAVLERLLLDLPTVRSGSRWSSLSLVAGQVAGKS